MTNRHAAGSKRVRIVSIVFVLWLALFGDFGCFRARGAVVAKQIDLSDVDLFSVPDWEHQQVIIAGVTLGMTRAQVFEAAGVRGLKLRSTRLPGTTAELHAPCATDSCSVSQVSGNWIGVDLSFRSDLVVKITVSVPVDAGPEVKAVNLARTFKGLTYRFFNTYSDRLRLSTLGAADEKETPMIVGTQLSNLASVEYGYSRLGLVVHITIDKRDNPPNPFDLKVDFVSAGMQ